MGLTVDDLTLALQRGVNIPAIGGWPNDIMLVGEGLSLFISEADRDRSAS
jgi:hypothetical protein